MGGGVDEERRVETGVVAHGGVLENPNQEAPAGVGAIGEVMVKSAVKLKSTSQNRTVPNVELLEPAQSAELPTASLAASLSVLDISFQQVIVTRAARWITRRDVPIGTQNAGAAESSSSRILKWV